MDPIYAPVESPAVKPRMSSFARFLLFASPFLLLGLVVATGVWVWGRLDVGPAAPYGNDDTKNQYVALANPLFVDDTVPPDGGRLYNHYCAHCHGVNGDGNGTTPLSPKARHFGYERFKFTDTLTGVRTEKGDPVPQGAAGTLGGIPTDDVLVGLVRRGIAGSPMPSFKEQMSEEQMRAVVGYVRTRFLRPQTLFEGRMAAEKRAVEELCKKDPAEFFEDYWPPRQAQKDTWFADAVADVTKSAPASVPHPFPGPKPGYELRAAALFEKLGCVGCHGKDGKGTFDPNRRNDNGTQAYPRDLTAAVYKGGPEPEDLFRRIYLGIPGTPMKAFGKEATTDEIIDLVYYVKDFAKRPVGVTVAQSP